MGNMDWLAVILGTLAFFAVGAVWYGALFGRAWQAEVGITEPPKGLAVARIMGLTLVLELLVAVTLAHQYAMTGPGDRAKMMIAIGYGLALMAPAIGINYLHQRKSLKLFAIDAGHLIVGMAAMGGVFVALD